MLIFRDKTKAWACMLQRNRAAKLAGNSRDVWVMVEAPVGWAVMSLEDAIELESGYEWAV